jgi:hypothetical protein
MLFINENMPSLQQLPRNVPVADSSKTAPALRLVRNSMSMLTVSLARALLYPPTPDMVFHTCVYLYYTACQVKIARGERQCVVQSSML